jgi:SAM-dependent methyltransferase
MSDIFYYKDLYRIAVGSKLKKWIYQTTYAKWFASVHSLFKDRKGLEIGGPSAIFNSNFMPVYQLAQSIDGCNFSNHTLWEGDITGKRYQYAADKAGHQYIMDGTDLHEIKNDAYEFLLSSHSLEHIANPLKALKEWQRVLKPNGVMLIILPDKQFTFDRHRPYTDLNHLLNDFKNEVGEDDLSHLREVLQLHDMHLDSGAGRDFSAFEKRCKNNLEHRGMHHHVFSIHLMQEIVAYLGMMIHSQYFIPPYHQITIAIKPLCPACH